LSCDCTTAKNGRKSKKLPFLNAGEEKVPNGKHHQNQHNCSTLISQGYIVFTFSMGQQLRMVNKKNNFYNNNKW
jgi:hypothetical protein